jgi:hypothetical protein
MKTEQCFCKSYSDDDHKIQDCTCGKCDTQEIQEWSEEFDKVWNYTVAPNKELVKSFISQKLKEQEERHKREIVESIFNSKKGDIVRIPKTDLSEQIWQLIEIIKNTDTDWDGTGGEPLGKI